MEYGKLLEEARDQVSKRRTSGGDSGNFRRASGRSGTLAEAGHGWGREGEGVTSGEGGGGACTSGAAVARFRPRRGGAGGVQGVGGEAANVGEGFKKKWWSLEGFTAVDCKCGKIGTRVRGTP